MAVINFYDNPLKKEATSIAASSNKTIRESINEYIKDKNIGVETFEIYDITTGETTYESFTPDGYKALVLVNGEEKDIEYTINDKDIVSIVFIPLSNSNSMDWLTIIGSALMIVAGVVIGVAGAAVGGWTVGVPMIVGGVMGLVGGIVSAITREPIDSKKNDTSKLETEQALTIKGAENQLIKDQRFPFVFGKMSINPYIIGSPYHETYTDADGKFHSQYFNALYCCGYGPLKLTNFKIGETVLTHNRARPDSEGEADNITVMHGNISAFDLATTFDPNTSYYVYNSYRRSYEKPEHQPANVTEFNAGTYYKLNTQIDQKWKNNDVTIEILQDGLNGIGELENQTATTQTQTRTDGKPYYITTEPALVNDKYGTLYNRTITEDQIDANLLFIHDADISEAASKSYKGVDIPQGFRTNTVRLSNSNPYHLEVELDFPSGIYRGRSETSGSTSCMRYYNIPIHYAIQWRCVYKDQKESDAEKADCMEFEIGNGTAENPQRPFASWRSFDYMKNGYDPNAWIPPQEYTIKKAITDLCLNYGSSYASQDLYNPMHNYAYDTHYQTWYNEAVTKNRADAIYGRVNTYGGPYYNPSERNEMVSSNSSSEAQKKVDEWVDIYNFDKVMQTVDAGYISEMPYNQGWQGASVFDVNYGKNCTSGYAPKDFNGNERIHVFTKDFTPEESQAILNSDADYVEIRVIRLTPCYIDQSGSNSEDHGDFSYQDLGKWTYLRTSIYDKDKYKEAGASANPADYPLRPMKAEDMKKFCFVAVRLKQDVAETGGSSLKKLRMVAESFSPTFNETTNKWQPEELHEKIRYCQKYYNEDTGKWVVDTTLTKEEYDQKIADHEEGLYTKRDGNDYIDQIASEIFTNSAKVATQPFDKYKLLDDVGTKYNDNNAASSTMLAFVGPQLGEYAKTYDSINLESAAEMFKFCKDVTDGTEDKANPGNLLHMKYSCNGVISGETKLETVIKDFLTTGRCVIKRDEHNKYDFFIGKKVKYVMDLLNNKSVISKSNTRTFADVPAGFQTTFQDEEDDYTVDPLYIMDDGEDWRNPSKSIEQISIQYVTNRNQMYSLCRYNLAARLYQRETYTRTIGKRGLTYSLGDVVLLQDDSLLVGTDNGARIVELIKDEDTNMIYGFFTDEPFEYRGEVEDGKCTQGITIVQPNKYGASRCVTLRLATPNGNAMIPASKMQIGLTNMVALAHPITMDEDVGYSEDESVQDGEFCTLDPKPGDLLAFGLMGSISIKAQVVAIKPSKGNYTLTLIPYNDDFYNFGREIPVFNTKMTVPDRAGGLSDSEFSSYATKADVADSKAINEERQSDPIIDLNATTTVTLCRATKDGILLSSQTESNGTRLKPLEVTWRIYRQLFDMAYTAAEVTQEIFDERKGSSENPLYQKVDEEYVYVTSDMTFDSEAGYFDGEATSVENLVSEITTNEEDYAFIFDRAKPIEQLGGYPEYTDFYALKVTATAKLTPTSRTSESVFTRVETDAYGTWIIQKPIINSLVTDRTATLRFSQPPTSGRTLYGVENIKYYVQIKRWGDNVEEQDTVWYRPNTIDNPYPDEHGGNEDNYKIAIVDETEQISYDTTCEICSNMFHQTLPLKGQGNNQSKNTSYRYKIYAESVSGQITESSEVTVTALITNIRDIVRANLTSKEEYVENLSAISANLGDISDGSLTGSGNNYWTLSTKENAVPGENNKDYKGAFRVGGNNKYLLIKPLLDESGFIYDYDFVLNVGAFEITTERTSLNSELVIYNPENTKFYRTRISINGIFFEYRPTEDANWIVVAKQDVGGILSKSVYSNDNILLTNMDISERRKKGYDIGKQYLSSNTKVYHFDTDEKDQYGNIGYTLLYEPSNPPCIVGADGKRIEINGGSSGNTIPMTDNLINIKPCILAVSPYSEVARSLYGIYGIIFNMSITNNQFTVDFWIKYYYAENQILFNIGTEQDKIQLICTKGEPDYNTPLEHSKAIPQPQSQDDIDAGVFYIISNGTFIRQTTFISNTTYYIEEPEPQYNTETNFSDQLVYNHAKSNTNDMYIKHQGVSTFETFRLAEFDGYTLSSPQPTSQVDFRGRIYYKLVNGQYTQAVSYEPDVLYYIKGEEFGEGSWKHIAITLDSENISCYIGTHKKDFARYSNDSSNTTAVINDSQHSLILDELMIDESAKESFESFVKSSNDKIPWGNISSEGEKMVLVAKEDNNEKPLLVTNIFNSDEFKNAVQAIIDSQ